MQTARVRQGFLAIVVVVTLLSIWGASAGATPPDDRDTFQGKQIFLSDDEDSQETPPFLVPYLSEAAKIKHQQIWSFGGRGDYSTMAYANNADFYYLYSRPPVAIGMGEQQNFQVGSNGVWYLWFDVPALRWVLERAVGMHTLSSARMDQVTKIQDTDSSSSLWVAGVGGGGNSRYIRDAHVDIVGVNGGAHLQVPGKDSVTMIDDTVRVLLHDDFRVVIPEEMGDGSCEEAFFGVGYPEARVCSVEVRSKSFVTRNASIGDTSSSAQLNADDPADLLSSPRSIQLTDIDVGEETNIEVRTQIRTVVFETKQVEFKIGGEWQDGPRYVEIHNDSVNVTDSQNAVVTPNQELNIHQRVIQAENERIVVVEFTGPSDLKERKLWSTLAFEDYTIQSGWGIYSKRSYISGVITHSSGFYFVDIPDQIRTYLTMRPNTPRVRERVYPGVGPVETGLYTEQVDEQVVPPNVGQTETFEWSSSAAELGDNVNLRTGPAVGYNAIVIRNAPSELQAVRGIHGNKYSYSTSHHEYHPTAIKSKRVSRTTVRFRVVDVETGQPVRGVTLEIDNGVRENATTNSDGEIFVESTGSQVQARFSGTSLLEDRDVYYSGSSQTILMPVTLDFDQIVADAIRSVLAVIIFILFYIPLRIIRKEPTE